VSAFHWRALGLHAEVQTTPLCRRHGVLKAASYVADDTCMAELDARTTRLAVLLGALVVVIILAATVPHQANLMAEVAIGISLMAICWLKGKRGFACLGIVIPLVWLTGAIRLGKPTSYWARRWYGDAKMAEAEQRFARAK
jgi:cell division protein FtsW (lipid II flippase)